MQLILKYNAYVVTDKMKPLAVNKLLLFSCVSQCCEVSQCEAFTSVLFRVSNAWQFRSGSIFNALQKLLYSSSLSYM